MILLIGNILPRKQDLHVQQVHKITYLCRQMARCLGCWPLSLEQLQSSQNVVFSSPNAESSHREPNQGSMRNVKAKKFGFWSKNR